MTNSRESFNMKERNMGFCNYISITLHAYIEQQRDFKNSYYKLEVNNEESKFELYLSTFGILVDYAKMSFLQKLWS